MAAPPSDGMPQPGAFVTPQACRDWARPTNAQLHTFFDPETYRAIGVCAPATRGPSVSVTMERHTTRENIATFFNPDTYRKPIGMVFPSPPCTDWAHVQKRAADSPLPGAPQAKRMMGKAELLEKFKLAAELNGMSWDDLIAIWLSISQDMSHFNFQESTKNVHWIWQ